MDALAIPGNAASSVAVPAGLVTEPTVDLDDPMGSAPVTAYFQFVQQNIQQVYNGNEDAIVEGGISAMDGNGTSQVPPGNP